MLPRLFAFSLLLTISLISQDLKKITDISPDGKSTHIYIKSDMKEMVYRTPQAPFGTTPAWTAGLERQIGGLAFGDFDMDGDLDLAAGCYFSNSFPPIPDYNNLIFRNDNGVLTVNPVWYSADSRSTTDIKWADINNDGKPDLFSGNGDGGYAPSTIYLNTGTGVPTTPSFTFAGLAWTVGTAFGDINGDGLPDLAVGNQGNTSDPYKPIFYYINQGTGFTTSPTYTSNDGMITNSVAFTDLDKSDLTRVQESFIISETGKGAVHLSKTPVVKVHSVKVNGVEVFNYCYDPVGAFVSAGGILPQGGTISVDYTHVKKGDLGVSKWVNFASGVYLNYMGGMSGTPAWTVGNTISQKGCGWGDFDLDGYADFVIGGNTNQNVMYKNTLGTLGSSPFWTSQTSPTPGVQELIVNDVNNDGYPDVSTVSFSPPRVEIYLNDNGTLPVTPSWTYIGASSLNSIAYGDVNGDGMLDLAVGTARTPIVLFLNQLTPVPVELVSFSASATNEGVSLTWTTASETNNKEFRIERKTGSNESWTEIGSVTGSGTTTQLKEYSFTDISAKNLSGKVLYRLNQTDFDGTHHYSKSVEAEPAGISSFELLGNFPNPFNPSTVIRFTLHETAFVTLNIWSATGEIVKSLKAGLTQKGLHDIGLDMSQSPSGVYLYTIEAAGLEGSVKRVTGKFVLGK